MIERLNRLRGEEDEEGQGGRGPGYRVFMEPRPAPPPPAPPPAPPPVPPPAPPPAPPPPVPVEVELEWPEALVQELRLLKDAARRDLLSDPRRVLTLLNGWDPAACQDIVLVYSDTVAPSSTSSYTATMPGGYVMFVLGVEWVVEVPYVLSLTMNRDTYLFHSDAALVESRREFPFWLPASNRWAISVGNTDAVFTTRVHAALQGFYLRAEIWNALRPLIQGYGRELSAGGG